MANIVVTGASRGLGLEFVKQLSKFPKTSTIFALCRNPEKAEKLQNVVNNSSNINIVKADMTNFDEYQDVVSNIKANLKSGGINLLINNAGIMVKDTFTSVKKENILNTFMLNSMAPLLFTKALYPILKKADGSAFPLQVGKAAVLNISAHLGSIGENTTGGYMSYRISKAAVNMITKSLAAEMKTADIFVMALHPGWVKTDMGGEAATLTTEQSVNGMLTVLSKIDESHRGCLFNNQGKRIPW